MRFSIKHSSRTVGLFLLVTLTPLTSVLSGQNAVETGSLRWRASQAKAQGQSRITIASISTPLGSMDKLDDALSNFTVATVRPIGTSVVAGAYSVTTWYKFKLISIFAKASKCLPCNPLPSPPPEFLPIHQDEVAVPMTGGTVIVDGVEITESSSEAYKFDSQSRYLLLFSGSISARRSAYIAAGRSGIYQLDDSGHLLGTVAGEGTPLSRDVIAHATISHLQHHLATEAK